MAPPLGELSPKVTERASPLAAHGQASLRTTSQSASQTAPLVGEPLAKPFTLQGLPKPPLGRGGGSASALTERLSPAAALTQASLPSQSGLRPPAPPKGEPLAGRATFRWTPEARQGAKGRALLQRAAASGQRSLSSCRCPRQRSTTVPETSCFARPGESCPTRQWLPLWGSCHRR